MAEETAPTPTPEAKPKSKQDQLTDFIKSQCKRGEKYANIAPFLKAEKVSLEELKAFKGIELYHSPEWSDFHNASFYARLS